MTERSARPARPATEPGFIRGVDAAVDRFYHGVVAHLGAFEARGGRRG
ncbi:hypothetical protein ACFY04_02320 [Streptomyces sp. NPDC001549]